MCARTEAGSTHEMADEVRPQMMVDLAVQFVPLRSERRIRYHRPVSECSAAPGSSVN